MAGALVPAVRRIGPMASLEELRQAVDDLQEFVQTREPLESGDPLDKYLTLRAAVESGLVIYRGPGGGGSGGGVGIPPVRPPEDWDDLTPPDPITTLTVDSIPTGFFIQFDPPTYRQGGGNAYTIIYRANYSGAGPLPTFGDAEECGRCTARNPIKVLAAEPGTISHFWAQPVSHAEDFQNVTPQTAPTGGTNGVSETAGQLNDDHIAELSAGKLTAGAIAVGEYIESAGYDPGVDGWRINGTGDAEFNDLVLRGTIYATAGLIGGATIAATYVQSTNYNGTGDGWKLDNANDKILAGKITISNTGATRVLNTEATGTNPVLKVGSSLSLLADGTGTLGALAIAASGYIRQGQTAYATGTGFWLGDASGTTKFSIGSSTSYMRWDGTDLLLTKPLMDAFTASISGGDMTVDQSTGGLFTVGSRTISPSGGKSPYEYNWMLQMLGQSISTSIFISSGGDTATVTVKAFGNGSDFVSPREYQYARLTCFVSDANGRVATDSIEVEVGFAAGSTSGE